MASLLIFFLIISITGSLPKNFQIKIKNFGEYRGWDDSTFAESCERYRYPQRFHYYEGEVKHIFKQ